MNWFASSRQYPPSRRKTIHPMKSRLIVPFHQAALPPPRRLLFFLLLPLLLPPCDSWTPQRQHYPGAKKSRTSQKQTISSLEAVTKRQSFILDGAELSYYIQSLLTPQPTRKESEISQEDGISNNAISVPDVAPKSPKKRNRVGYLTFVTAVAEEDIYWDGRDDEDNNYVGKPWISKGQRFIGVEVGECGCPSNTTGTASLTSAAAIAENSAAKKRATICIDNNSTFLYRDSIAILPPSPKIVSDADAISTASVALLGVHCALPPGAIDRLQFANNKSGEESEDKVKESVAKVEDKRGRSVIVGGGDYAIYLCKAMVACGIQTYLVSDRPKWSLPSANELLPKGTKMKQAKKDTMVEILSPSVGQLSLGFAMAIGDFDSLVDTLGDEMGVGRLRSVVQGASGVSGFLAQMQELHGCSKYISTLTRSQQYVLNKGLLFARDPVIRYQQEVEKLPIMRKCHYLPPPLDFGSTTLQTLLDKGVIYPSNQNENGAHASKSAFVRGWSLSDLTELKTWPRDTKTGTGRFGFPEVKLSLSSPHVLKSVKEDIDKEKTNSSNSIVENLSRSKTIVEEVKPKTSSQSKGQSNSNHTSSSISERRLYANSTDFNNTDSIIIKNTKTKRTKVTTNSSSRSTTPFVASIKSASDLNNLITERKRNCILFIKASFCKKCQSLFPQYVHMARLASESAPSVMFAHLDISSSAREKQLGSVLGVDKVPSIVIFRDGQPVKGDNGESSKVIEKRVMKELEDAAKSLEIGEAKNLDVLLKMKSVKKSI